MKRTPLKRKSRLRPMSKKREEDAKLYSLRRKDFLEQYKFCQVCHESKPQDVHHKAGRGKNYLLVDTWLAVCRSCHDDIHRNPTLAREQGYLI